MYARQQTVELLLGAIGVQERHDSALQVGQKVDGREVVHGGVREEEGKRHDTAHLSAHKLNPVMAVSAIGISAANF
jgi:hypothetical protein